MWYNKIAYLIYKLYRFFIVSVWYYFVPFLAIVANFIIPTLLIKAGTADAGDIIPDVPVTTNPVAS